MDSPAGKVLGLHMIHSSSIPGVLLPDNLPNNLLPDNHPEYHWVLPKNGEGSKRMTSCTVQDASYQTSLIFKLFCFVLLWTIALHMLSPLNYLARPCQSFSNCFRRYLVYKRKKLLAT